MQCSLDYTFNYIWICLGHSYRHLRVRCIVMYYLWSLCSHNFRDTPFTYSFFIYNHIEYQACIILSQLERHLCVFKFCELTDICNIIMQCTYLNRIIFLTYSFDRRAHWTRQTHLYVRTQEQHWSSLWLVTWVHISVQLESQYINFHSGISIWKYRLKIVVIFFKYMYVTQTSVFY